MYKKHSSFSFIALLCMPSLSEHERSGAIRIFKSLTSPDIIIAIHQLYSASEIVIRLLAQLKMDAGLASQDCELTIFTSTISIPDGYCKYRGIVLIKGYFFSDF